MPAPKNEAEYLAWAKAGMLTPAEMGIRAPAESGIRAPAEPDTRVPLEGREALVEQLLAHLVASLDHNVEKAASAFAAGRLDTHSWLAIGTLEQTISGIERSLGHR
jgi:hypothetical protein